MGEKGKLAKGGTALPNLACKFSVFIDFLDEVSGSAINVGRFGLSFLSFSQSTEADRRFGLSEETTSCAAF